FQSSALDKWLTVYDNLQSRAALYGITGAKFKQRYEELASLLHFSDLTKRTLGKLSGGQKRRIDIARALLHRPEILVLDEPTTGLDPQTRKLMWQVVTDLREREGLTVFLTTHYMEEAADADYVVILDGGKKVAEGTPLKLKNDYTNDYINVYGRNTDELSALGYPCKEIVGGVRISVPDTAHAAELIAAHRTLFTDFEILKGNMDDVFLAVTGKELSAGELV
ncbi:MAG: ABC transporter ATP-binding protein, partial [Clostridia bacterium]|nr:ABC transporter ATP-binding protein [Clostridia bacterium]